MLLSLDSGCVRGRKNAAAAGAADGADADAVAAAVDDDVGIGWNSYSHRVQAEPLLRCEGMPAADGIVVLVVVCDTGCAAAVADTDVPGDSKGMVALALRLVCELLLVA